MFFSCYWDVILFDLIIIGYFIIFIFGFIVSVLLSHDRCFIVFRIPKTCMKIMPFLFYINNLKLVQIINGKLG